MAINHLQRSVPDRGWGVKPPPVLPKANLWFDGAVRLRRPYSGFRLSRAFGAVGMFGVWVGRVVVMVVIVIISVVVVMVVVVIILGHEAAHAGAEQIAVRAIGHV